MPERVRDSRAGKAVVCGLPSHCGAGPPEVSTLRRQGRRASRSSEWRPGQERLRRWREEARPGPLPPSPVPLAAAMRLWRWRVEGGEFRLYVSKSRKGGGKGSSFASQPHTHTYIHFTHLFTSSGARPPHPVTRRLSSVTAWQRAARASTMAAAAASVMFLVVVVVVVVVVVWGVGWGD
jgi:hypothetical protein